MQTISPEYIDQFLDELDGLDEFEFEARMAEFAAEQPVVFTWLFSEQFDILSDDEKDYLRYLALCLWAIIKKHGGAQEMASEDAIGEAEEWVYSVLEQGVNQPFNERLDPFYEDIAPEAEELLVLAEDSVSDDPDEEEPAIVTKEGREPIFAALMTMIKALS